MNPERRMPGGEEGADEDTTAQPDVGSDRSVPAKDGGPGRAPEERRSRPLAIEEIEELEDDAPGG
jgi:hypothetical protein